MKIIWIAFTLIGCHQLDYYPLQKNTPLRGDFRTMQQHDELMQGKDWPYVLHLEGHKGALLYFGSYHIQDPSDKQVEQIKKRWSEFKPTIAVTENRLGFHFGGEESGVSSFGEFAMAYHLGTEIDIPVFSLEPQWIDEVNVVKEQFETEDITLFYTLRVFFNERKGVDPEDIDDLAAHLLSKRGSRDGLAGSLKSLKEMDDLWQRKYKDLGDWRTAPHTVLGPNANPTTDLHRIGNLVNEARDIHAAKIISELVNKGERVFAIAGGSHVVKQEPVLRATIN
jgi:hypothetical protein